MINIFIDFILKIFYFITLVIKAVAERILSLSLMRS